MIAPRRAARPRFELFGDSLSGRVLWLTVGVILAIELIVLLPGLGRLRQDWMWERVTHAQLVLYTAEQTGTPLSPALNQTLLNYAGVSRIELDTPGQPPLVLQSSPPMPAPDQYFDISNETISYSTWRACLRIAGSSSDAIGMEAPSPLQPDTMVKVVADAAPLRAELRTDAAHVFMLTVIVALVTGLLVFAVLDRLLVRPMRVITTSIINFREDPEQEEASDLAWLAARPEDDISTAARELKIMQDEMRAALWRNARLAAVGTSVAKISHDLRNILSTALLVADRLQTVSDPAVQRATRTLIPAVERAAQLVSRTVDFAREGPPPITRSAVELADLAEEAISMVRPVDPEVRFDNQIPEHLVLALDRAQIYRVLVNLMRNAAEAGVKTIRLTTDRQGAMTRLRVSDDGPGLPLRVQDNLFKPFTSSGRYGGTGLGLAIARDLIRAHGGDLVLEQTGPRGTVFCMDLAVSETQT
jgi:signal transduction histidine kinase